MTRSPRKTVHSDNLNDIVSNKLYGIDKKLGAYLRFKNLNLKALIKLDDNYMTLRGNPVDTLTIYFIKVDSPHRGKGNFSEFLKEIQKVARNNDKSILIQEVINPNLEKILKRKGYKRIDKGDQHYDYIKL